MQAGYDVRMHIAPDLEYDFRLPGGTIRVCVVVQESDQSDLHVSTVSGRDDTTTILVVCPASAVSDSDDDRRDRFVQSLVDATRPYLSSEPTQVQLDQFHDALHDWVSERR